MNNNSKNTVTKKGQLSPGEMASRTRSVMEQMKADDLKYMQESRAKREKLARELAELEVKARRDQRLHETNEMKTACYALGELVLEAIRVGSITNFTLSNVDLLQLSLDKQELVERVAGREKTKVKPQGKASKSQANDSTTEPDIPL